MFYSHTQARAKLPKKRRRIMPVEHLPRSLAIRSNPMQQSQQHQQLPPGQQQLVTSGARLGPFGQGPPATLAAGNLIKGQPAHLHASSNFAYYAPGSGLLNSSANPLLARQEGGPATPLVPPNQTLVPRGATLDSLSSRTRLNLSHKDLLPDRKSPTDSQPVLACQLIQSQPVPTQPSGDCAAKIKQQQENKRSEELADQKDSKPSCEQSEPAASSSHRKQAHHRKQAQQQQQHQSLHHLPKQEQRQEQEACSSSSCKQTMRKEKCYCCHCDDLNHCCDSASNNERPLPAAGEPFGASSGRLPGEDLPAGRRERHESTIRPPTNSNQPKETGLIPTVGAGHPQLDSRSGFVSSVNELREQEAEAEQFRAGGGSPTPSLAGLDRKDSSDKSTIL